MNNLTEKQAFVAMSVFIRDYYERTKLKELGNILGDIRLLPHGAPADPAAQEDWHDAVQKVLSYDIAGGDVWE